MNSIDVLRQNEPLWGEWTLGSSIGSGVQSQVFLVSGEDGEHRALKVVTMGRHKAQQDAVREQVGLTDRMGQLDGVVPCLRTGEFGDGDDRVAVMLMPLLTPLSDILMERDEDMGAGEVLNIARDLCGALVRCQSSGVIHRDIKPANVFSDEEGRFYLGDLGVARNLEHTMLATRKGTPAYMSPEIASGKPCSFSSDVYSLGIMLYQLLNAGRLPLLGRDARYTEIEEAVTRRLNGEPLPLPENANDRLGQLVCEMCDPEPRNRPSAQQCLEEFDELAQMLEANGELPPARTGIPLRSNGRLIACIAAAVVLLAAVTAAAFLSKGKDLPDFPQASSPAVNSFSSGGTAGDADWLYFGSDEAGSAAYRVSRDTGLSETIYDGSITHLNLCRDRLFFTANHTIERAERLEDGSVIAYMRDGVRSMRTDGTDEQILCRCETSCAVEYDGWIYHYVSKLNRRDLVSGLHNDDSNPTFSQVLRVKADGSKEESLWRENGIYTTGMYVYRDRIYLLCTDYNTAEDMVSYVLSMAADGTDVCRIIDGYVGCLDFSGEYICYTTDRLLGSAIMKKPIEGDQPAQLVSDMQTTQFCVYEEQFIVCASGSSDDACGVFLCGTDGKPVRRLLDECASRIELAGDILIVETKEQRMTAIDIESGETFPVDDFRFELY